MDQRRAVNFQVFGGRWQRRWHVPIIPWRFVMSSFGLSFCLARRKRIGGVDGLIDTRTLEGPPQPPSLLQTPPVSSLPQYRVHFHFFTTFTPPSSWTINSTLLDSVKKFNLSEKFNCHRLVWTVRTYNQPSQLVICNSFFDFLWSGNKWTDEVDE